MTGKKLSEPLNKTIKTLTARAQKVQTARQPDPPRVLHANVSRPQTHPAAQRQFTPAAHHARSGVRVLQTKAKLTPAKTQISAPPAFRPNAVPKVLQSKMKEVRPEVPRRLVAQRGAAPTPKAKEQSTVQRFASRVVQPLKLYPNLHPGAVEPVNQGNVFRLNSFANQYRLHRVDSHSVNVPNQQYNFVRTREGEMLLHARYRHPSIAEGKQVLYAGEIFFNNGQLEWWSNGSGHYQPYADDAEQANLPMDQFYSYQQVIKGEHKRKRG